MWRHSIVHCCCVSAHSYWLMHSDAPWELQGYDGKCYICYMGQNKFLDICTGWETTLKVMGHRHVGSHGLRIHIKAIEVKLILMAIIFLNAYLTWTLNLFVQARYNTSCWSAKSYERSLASNVHLCGWLELFSDCFAVWCFLCPSRKRVCQAGQDDSKKKIWLILQIKAMLIIKKTKLTNFCHICVCCICHNLNSVRERWKQTHAHTLLKI